jgi:hypothetical protein
VKKIDWEKPLRGVLLHTHVKYIGIDIEGNRVVQLEGNTSLYRCNDTGELAGPFWYAIENEPVKEERWLISSYFYTTSFLSKEAADRYVRTNVSTGPWSDPVCVLVELP